MPAAKKNKEITIAIIGAIGAILVVLVPLLWNKIFKTSANTFINYEGTVKNRVTGTPVADAIVSFIDKPAFTPVSTDSRGVFSIRLPYSEDYTARIQVVHKEFISWNNFRLLTSKPMVEEIILDPIKKEDPGIPAKANEKQSLHPHQISGVVQDANGNPVSNVTISIIGDIDKVISTSTGTFLIKTNQQGYAVRLQASRQGYEPWNDYVSLDRKDLVIQINSLQ